MGEGNGIKATNLEIWSSVGILQALMQAKFPVRTALALAKLANRLVELRKPIEETRVNKLKDFRVEKTAPVLGEDGKPQLGDDGKPEVVGTGEYEIPAHKREEWNRVFNELMEQECEDVVLKEKIKLPEKVSATCDKCRHNMERPLEIEPYILAALDKFIEV